MTDKYVSGLLKMVPVDIISCFPTLYVYLSLLFFLSFVPTRRSFYENIEQLSLIFFLSFHSDATMVLQNIEQLSLIFFSVFIPTRRSFYKKYRTKQQINRLAISPQKNVIAAAGNPCAKLFDIHTSNTTFACDSHSGNITSVGFQRLGRWFYVRVFF